MRLTNSLALIVLFSIVAVEFGGWSLLGFLTSQNRLSAVEEQFFRVGHGHAGVLLILVLVYLVLMDRTRFTSRTRLSLRPNWEGLIHIARQASAIFGLTAPTEAAREHQLDDDVDIAVTTDVCCVLVGTLQVDVI